MVGLDSYLFGYRLLYPEQGGEARLANALLRLGIPAVGRADGGYVIKEADVGRFVAYAGGRVRYRLSPPRGLPARLCALRHFIPELAAALISVALLIFLSHLVWDVRIEGAENIPVGDIASALEESGLSVGAIWDRIDPEECEVGLLSREERVAWVQISRVGTVAYVTVRERAELPEPEPTPYACSNILADFDGVIEEITVRSGRALVKPGDVVRRGDVLISGIVETEAGSYFTAAEGSVRAHVCGSVEALAEYTELSSELAEGECAALALKIFGLKINIFKNYGNSQGDCAIIEDEEEHLSLFGKRLPLSLIRARTYVRTDTTRTYTASELPNLASKRLEKLLAERLGEADLIKLSTSGSYTDTGYTLRADYVISREIGEEREVVVKSEK